MVSRIYMSSPDMTDLEEDALIAAFRSGWVAPAGPALNQFEADLCEAFDRKYAVALSSGTAALHLGLLGLGVKPGDAVVTSTLTFAATANAITYVGAEPIFVDCDGSGCMNPNLLETALSQLLSEGRRLGAIVPVDLLGKVADQESIAAVASQFGVPVFSDAAESVGALRRGRPAPSFGNAAAVSFNGNKIITSSGGGAFVTDDGPLAEYVRYLSTQARQPVVHYEHTETGYNYRMSNLLAALGSAQLSRLPEMMARRQGMRVLYKSIFDGVAGVSVFGEPSIVSNEGTVDNAWLSSILVDRSVAGWSAQDLLVHLDSDSIESRPMWKPMHMQPAFAGCTSVLDGTSERLFEQGLSLPSGSNLGDAERDRISRSIESFIASV